LTSEQQGLLMQALAAIMLVAHPATCIFAASTTRGVLSNIPFNLAPLLVPASADDFAGFTGTSLTPKTCSWRADEVQADTSLYPSSTYTRWQLIQGSCKAKRATAMQVGGCFYNLLAALHAPTARL
jgi:hypothetical protein